MKLAYSHTLFSVRLRDGSLLILPSGKGRSAFILGEEEIPVRVVRVSDQRNQ